MSSESKQAIETLCPEVDKAVIEDFFARMDDDYFATFSPEDIATHIRMACALDPKHRVRVRVIPRQHGTFDIIIVGFDYLSEFSIFSGLLSAFGLHIRAGNIYSFGRGTSRSSPSKIVDVFGVGIKAGETFDEPRQQEFEQELQTFAQLLSKGAIEEVRERLNRSLTERIERMNEPLTGLLAPVEIHFDNQLSSDWTVMEVRSE